MMSLSYKLLPILKNYYREFLQIDCKKLWLGTGSDWMDWEGSYSVWTSPKGTKLEHFWFFNRTVSVSTQLLTVCPLGMPRKYNLKHLFKSTLAGKVCSWRHAQRYENLLLRWNRPVSGKESLVHEGGKGKQCPGLGGPRLFWDDGAPAPCEVTMEVVSAWAGRQLCVAIGWQGKSTQGW